MNFELEIERDLTESVHNGTEALVCANNFDLNMF